MSREEEVKNECFGHRRRGLHRFSLRGAVAVGNRGVGVRIDGVSHNLIGGDMPGERNLISGNGEGGVQIESYGAMSNVVSGNYIGTDVNGSTSLSNADDGVKVEGEARYNLIGGDTPGERNQ